MLNTQTLSIHNSKEWDEKCHPILLKESENYSDNYLKLYWRQIDNINYEIAFLRHLEKYNTSTQFYVKKINSMIKNFNNQFMIDVLSNSDTY